jgi:hypothetical protein
VSGSGPVRRRADRGAATIAVVLGLFVLMLAFVGLANFVVFQYGRGALQTAVEQAARAGSRASADLEDCERRGDEALDAVLGGSLRGGATVSCSQRGDQVVARTSARFEPWLAVFPAADVDVSATARKEQLP